MKFCVAALMLVAAACLARSGPAHAAADELNAHDGGAAQDQALAAVRLRGLQQSGGGIQACLSAIQGLEVLTPASSNFAAARSVFNLRVQSSPALITRPTTVNQVSKIVKCAVQNGKQVVPLSGGHSYEGFGVQAGKVVVDLEKMAAVTLQRDPNRAVIQAGAKLGPVYKALWDQSGGTKSIPAGTCPSVGIGGHLLGGGFGMIARKYGLTADRLVSVEMVLADGRIVTANATDNSDLLWACQGGGGGNFGLATSFTVHTAAVTPQVTLVVINWDMASAAAAIQWYLRKVPTLTTNLTTDLFLGFGSVQLHGVFMGSPASARQVLDASGIGNIGTPTKNQLTAMSYIDAVVQLGVQAQQLSPAAPNSLSLGAGVSLQPRDSFKAKSNFIKSPITAAGVDVAVSKLAAANSQGIGGWMQFHAYGGNLNTVPAAATAFVHRNTLASVQYYVSWTDNSQAQRSTSWLNDFWGSMRSYVDASAYQNYIDKDLGANSQTAYYGSNLPRLQQIKATYDPKQFWGYANSITPAAAPVAAVASQQLTADSSARD